MNLIFAFTSCSEPPGWPLQATRGRDLLPGEQTPWPVGAWTSPAGTLKGPAAHTRTKTGAFRVQILKNRCCSCRDGLEWTWPGCLDWPAGTKGSPSVKQSGDLFTKSVLCQSYKQKIWIPFRPHFYIVSKTRPKFLFCVLTETCPHPNLNLEYLCVFYGVDRNAVMKLCTTFQCILT